MKRRITMLFSAGLLVASLGYAQAPNPGQTPNPNAPQNTPDANRPAANPQATPGQGPATSASEKTFEGRLTKIDTATKTITVSKEGETRDMTFKYGDRTVVVGGDRTVQGLSGKTGSTLKITYQAESDNNNMASRIEISDKP